MDQCSATATPCPNKMSERLSEMQMQRLVEIYREHECLWDVSNDLYKNREARESAYKKICKTLNIPGLVPRDIPKKIKNVRSSYYHEVKRINKSIRSGATGDNIYKPRVCWFETADTFLKTYRIRKESFANYENSYLDIPTSDDDTETQNMDSSDRDEDNSIIKQENDPLEQLQSEGGSSHVADDTYNNDHRPLQTPIKRLKKNKKHFNSVSIYKALGKIGKISEKLQSHVTEDEFDSFGKYIAISLRAMPREFSITAKTELQKTISEIQLSCESVSCAKQHKNEKNRIKNNIVE